MTALRWAKILRKLGHRVSISTEYNDDPYDLLVALHARRSYSSILRFRRKHSDAAIFVALTGTDLYRDIQTSRRAQKSLDMADKIIVLQPGGLRELPPAWRKKSRVIYQSVKGSWDKAKVSRSPNSSFELCVIGHLRPVKDPFRAALASRLLPASSQIRIRQIGAAMTKPMLEKARREMKINRRYRWLGELAHSRALRRLASSDLCIVSSWMEGGANVLSEAIVASIPVLASRIDGNAGILGDDYPGLFPAGHTRQLAQLMTRAEIDPKFVADLRRRIKKLASLFDPAQEERAWARLIDEIC